MAADCAQRLSGKKSFVVVGTCSWMSQIVVLSNGVCQSQVGFMRMMISR